MCESEGKFELTFGRRQTTRCEYGSVRACNTRIDSAPYCKTENTHRSIYVYLPTLTDFNADLEDEMMLTVLCK
jgi:hypothetical protein